MLIAIAAGCGGASQDLGTPVEAARAQQTHATKQTVRAPDHGSGEAGEMAGMPPAVEKFHALLGPRWHAERGPKRMTDTCAAIPQLRSGADAIAKTAPPAGADTAAWAAAGQRLGSAVAALGDTCTASDAAKFEGAFAEVHRDFHAVLGAGGGPKEPGEAEGHDEPDDHPHGW